MLTQEQADKMLLAQNQLEAAQVSYNNLQKKLDSYDRIMNEVSANYNNYSAEQKAKIDSLLPQISEQYNLMRQQKQDQYLAQYEAQQQIDYYNQLDAQQSAPAAWWRRKIVIPEEVIVPTPTPTPEQKWTWTPMNKFWPGGSYSNPWNRQSGNNWNYTVPGWISTAEWPRYVGANNGWNRQTAQNNTSGGATTWINMASYSPNWMSTNWPLNSGFQYTGDTTANSNTGLNGGMSPARGWMSTANWPVYVGPVNI